MSRLYAALAAALLLAGCGSDTVDLPLPSPGPDTKTYLFAMQDNPTGTEDFVAVTADEAVIAKAEAQLALPEAQRSLIISGPIDRTNGGHNLGWSWHFVPGQWDLVDLATEVCDGRPTFVEEELDYWVDDVGLYCPWSARVKAELAGTVTASARGAAVTR